MSVSTSAVHCATFTVPVFWDWPWGWGLRKRYLSCWFCIVYLFIHTECPSSSLHPSFKICPIICFLAQGFSLLMTPLYISSTPLKSLHPKRIKSHRILSFNPAGQPHSHHGCYMLLQHVTTIALHWRCIIGFLIRCSMRCVSHRGHKNSAF